MKPLLKKHESKLRFALIGGLNTAIDFGILFLLSGFGINKYAANFVSTSVAFVFSFFANRNFAFKSTASMKKQIIPFAVVTLLGLWALQPAVIWLVLHPLAGLDDVLALFIAKIIATGASMTWNYLLYSRFVFKS